MSKPYGTIEEQERLLNTFRGIIGNFIEFDKRLYEIAQEAEVPYEEIWACWKEQRHTAGLTIE